MTTGTLGGGGGAITTATGVQVSTGGFGSGAAAGVHNIATITLIGGGNVGQFGLDQVYAGWVNNVTASDIFSNYLDTSVTPNAPHNQPVTFAQNSPSVHPVVTGGAITTRYQLGVFYKTGMTAPAGWASSSAARIPLALPVLDVSPFGSEGTGGNTCVGTESIAAPGPPVAISKVPLPRPRHRQNFGQDWTVEQWDSPGLSASPAHIMFPGVLRAFRFSLDFRCDLVVWTNFTKAAGATGDAACRLYSTVQSDNWTIRYEIRFALPTPGPPPAPGRGTVAVPPKIKLTKDRNPTRQAKTVRGSGLEVRFPIALMCYCIDAST